MKFLFLYAFTCLVALGWFAVKVITQWRRVRQDFTIPAIIGVLLLGAALWPLVLYLSWTLDAYIEEEVPFEEFEQEHLS